MSHCFFKIIIGIVYQFFKQFRDINFKNNTHTALQIQAKFNPF